MPTPEQTIKSLRQGELLPVYVLVGEESYFRDQVIAEIRAVAGAGGIPGLNSDDFTAMERTPAQVSAAARTLPMLAPKRIVLVRDVEHWEKKAGEEKPVETKGNEEPGTKGARKGKKSKSDAQEQLLRYLEDPSPSTVLVLVASKLDARRKLTTVAKQKNLLVACERLSKNALLGWLKAAAERRGVRLLPAVAELIVEVGGAELALLDDVIERLSLFVGKGGQITEDTVAEVIPIARPATVWDLTAAVAERSVGQTLGVLDRVFVDPKAGPQFVGALAWSARQLIKGQGRQGSQGLSPVMLENWLTALRDIDLNLKGGSKRPSRAVFEAALIDWCRK